MSPEGSVGGVRIDNLQEGPGIFERLFNEGDADGLASLYEPDAVLVSETGQQAEGRAAIRAALAELVRDRPVVTVTRRSALKSGGLVLAFYDWTITSQASEGTKRAAGGSGALVLRQQSDGAWMAVLDTMLG